jgi:hypothetical protein
MCRLPLLAGVVAAGLLAAGCNRAPLHVAPGRTVAVTATDFRLHPQRIAVRPGPVTFRLVNRGRLPHDWQIRGPGVHGRVRLMLPGDRRRVTVRLRRGVYAMFSGHGHDEILGDYGSVTVR